MIKKIECYGCEYFDSAESVCRRYAPKPYAHNWTNDPLATQWPTVYEGDWCGEFKINSLLKYEEGEWKLKNQAT
jgi:hypothetical protein